MLARFAGRRVLVVTHAGPLRSTVRDALGVRDGAPLWRLGSEPTGLTETSWWADGGASVGTWNETGHLHAAGIALR
ncbi:hypothetical protein GCM10025868_45720 [Angustibacter aerolatus]|uniref:Phosphoglycerate mutase n=1 Tax=Angustibacter aerolatus TaxID=1162965 RepID=A0ABQ6JM22_9ACTN|nr:hypothetical protein GCM10025868_45720 [Angustibacter aerolatus]